MKKKNREKKDKMFKLNKEQSDMLLEMEKETENYANGHCRCMITNIKEEDVGSLIESLYKNKEINIICNTKVVMVHKDSSETYCLYFDTHNKYDLMLTYAFEKISKENYDDVRFYSQNLWDNEECFSVVINGKEQDIKDLAYCDIQSLQEEDIDTFYLDLKIEDKESHTAFHIENTFSKEECEKIIERVRNRLSSREIIDALKVAKVKSYLDNPNTEASSVVMAECLMDDKISTYDMAENICFSYANVDGTSAYKEGFREGVESVLKEILNLDMVQLINKIEDKENELENEEEEER